MSLSHRIWQNTTLSHLWGMLTSMLLTGLPKIWWDRQRSLTLLLSVSIENRGSYEYQFAPLFDNKLRTRFHPDLSNIVAVDVRRTMIVRKGERAYLRTEVSLSSFVLRRIDYEECEGSIEEWIGEEWMIVVHCPLMVSLWQLHIIWYSMTSTCDWYNLFAILREDCWQVETKNLMKRRLKCDNLWMMVLCIRFLRCLMICWLMSWSWNEEWLSRM